MKGYTDVIDLGMKKAALVDEDANLPTLLPVPITQFSAIQRAGRAGRVVAGIFWRMYSQEEYDAMENNWLACSRDRGC